MEHGMEHERNIETQDGAWNGNPNEKWKHRRKNEWGHEQKIKTQDGEWNGTRQKNLKRKESKE